jgi:hypothetical protein
MAARALPAVVLGALLLVASIATTAHADTVILKDGTELKGTITETVEGVSVSITTESGSKETIPWAEVKRVIGGAAAPKTDKVILKDGSEIEGTITEQKEGEYLVITTTAGGKETISWTEVKRVVLAPGHTPKTVDATTTGATNAAPTAAATPAPASGVGPTGERTTFFSMSSGIGSCSYSGKSETGTEITGSGIVVASSLQGGFFITPSLAIGAGGSFVYMPSPSGERGGRAADNLDAAPGGFLGPALRFYPSETFFLAAVLGYGGAGNGKFGGTGPALAPSVGFDFYQRGHFRIGVEGHFYYFALSSSHESGKYLGGAALLSVSYL